MEYFVEQVDSVIRKLKLTVGTEEVQSKLDKSYKDLKKYVSIPGFRKGKVPLELIKARYSKDVEAEAFDELINEKFKEIMQTEHIRVIGSGVVESMDWKATEGLFASIEFQVAPQVELKKIDQLRAEKEIRPVTDEDVDNAIEHLRKQHAVVKPIENGAQDGHFILADFQELDTSGMPIIGKKLLDRYFRLGSGIFGSSFDEKLIGVKPGDERSVEVTYEAAPRESKREYYKVQVKKVEEQILPELDDEFAISVGEYEKFADLKEAIRQQLLHEVEQQSEDKLHESLIDEVIKNNPFDLPPLMVDSYLETWFQDVKKQSKQELNERELKERNRPFAIRNLKWHMLKDEIIEHENLKVNDADLEQSFNDIAEKAKVNLAEIKKYYKDKEHLNELRHQIEEKRIFERLLQTAEIAETDVSDKKSNLIYTT